MALTEDYTFLFSDTGTVLNTSAVVTNPFVDVDKVTGLDNTDFRTTERDREGMDGGFIDALYEKIRFVTLEGTIYNATEVFLDTLKANFAPGNVAKPFYFKSPATAERLVYCKSYGIKFDWDTNRRLNMVKFQIQLKAEDPSIYGALIAGSVNLGGTSTGFGFPIGFPLGFGGVSSNIGAASINNIGNRDTDAVFIINGPVTNPALLHDNTGNKLTFAFVLGTGEYLTVNLRNKSVILNGTANRRGTLTGTSRWFMLVPGVNTVRFLGTPGASTPTVSYSVRSAYR